MDSRIVDIYVQCKTYIELVLIGFGYNDRFFFLGVIALTERLRSYIHRKNVECYTYTHE